MLRRYTPELLADIWGWPNDDDFLEHRYGMWLQVVLSCLRERVRIGQLTEADGAAIEQTLRVDVRRIGEIEVRRRHDFVAFIESLFEQLDRAGLWHLKRFLVGEFGSYDIEDPAFMAMIHRSLVLIETAAKGAESALWERAKEQKITFMMARTHGQFAMPTVFGHLLLVYRFVMTRNVLRIRFCIDHECAEASMAGDVGNFAGMEPEACEGFCAAFGFKHAVAETQVVMRDRHAMIMATLAVVAASIQQMAETFWLMMRGDVGELQEPFRQGQKGSKGMPHKRNPIVTEQLRGMPRLVIGDAVSALMNCGSNPEFRDIGQSCVERHIFPDTLTEMHYMLEKLEWLVRGMIVKVDGMRANIEKTFGTWAGQRLRDALITAGVDPTVADDYVQRISFEAVDTQTPLMTLGRSVSIDGTEDGKVAETVLGHEAFEAVFDIAPFVTPGIEHMFRRAGLAEEVPPLSS